MNPEVKEYVPNPHSFQPGAQYNFNNPTPQNIAPPQQQPVCYTNAKNMKKM